MTGIRHAALRILSKGVTARVSRQQLDDGTEELQVGLAIFQVVGLRQANIGLPLCCATRLKLGSSRLIPARGWYERAW